ncbi:MAG: hypothetical protein KIS67_01950 [Verrucomicrobiae bacterium]|nr:hypothetical protein [Verrucomicrobiae bacterium]
MKAYKASMVFAPLAMVGLFLILTVPVIEFGEAGTYDADETRYHYPTVQKILSKWPAVDLANDPDSAVSPGYHYFLATILHFAGGGIHTLRYVNLLFSLGVPLALFFYARRFTADWQVCLMLLPLVSSNYLVKAACWVVTDNAALLLAVITLLLLFSGRDSSKQLCAAGGVAALATFTRQLHVWLAIPIAVSGVFFVSKTRTFSRLVLAVAAGFAPLVILVILYQAWNGFVPPAWESMSVKLSLCPIAYILSVFAIFGVFFVPFQSVRQAGAWLVDLRVQLAAAFGLATAVLTPTSYSHAEGRWGGYLWEVARHLPVIWDRSVLFAAAAPVGAALVAIMFIEIKRTGATREAFLWIASVAGWGVSFVINRQVFHRYYEPMVLAFLLIAVFQLHTSASPKPMKLPLRRMMALGVMQIIITAATVLRGLVSDGVH